MKRKPKPKAIIYGLRAKSDADYFYIGSTERDPQIRLRAHCFGHNRNPFVKARIALAGRKNVEIEVIETCAVSRRFKREYAVIGEHKARGVNLCNVKLEEKQPAWVMSKKEAENRALAGFFEAHSERNITNAGARLFERIWDAQIVKLKINSDDTNTSPDLLRRINALPWPQYQPIHPTRAELKSAFDSINLGTHERRQLYKAAETLRH